MTFVHAIRTCLTNYAAFEGRAERAEYWWFMLFVVLAGSIGTVVHEVLGSVVLLLVLVPLPAAGARRSATPGTAASGSCSPWRPSASSCR